LFLGCGNEATHHIEAPTNGNLFAHQMAFCPKTFLRQSQFLLPLLGLLDMTNCGSNITSFCFAKETKCLNYTNFMEIVKKCDSDSSDSYLVGFWVFYGLTVTGVIFMAIREFVQV